MYAKIEELETDAIGEWYREMVSSNNENIREEEIDETDPAEVAEQQAAAEAAKLEKMKAKKKAKKDKKKRGKGGKSMDEKGGAGGDAKDDDDGDKGKKIVNPPSECRAAYPKLLQLEKQRLAVGRGVREGMSLLAVQGARVENRQG